MQDTKAHRGGGARVWLSLGLAIGLALATVGCVAGDDIETEGSDPPTAQTEQGLGSMTCDYQYYDRYGTFLGQCVVWCGRPAQCIGTTSGPQVAWTEWTCEPCQ